MCYNCADKFAPGHKCKSKFFLLVGDDEGQDYALLEKLSTEEDTTVSSNFVVPEVSMHALSFEISPRTIKVTG